MSTPRLPGATHRVASGNAVPSAANPEALAQDPPLRVNAPPVPRKLAILFDGTSNEDAMKARWTNIVRIREQIAASAPGTSVGESSCLWWYSTGVGATTSEWGFHSLPRAL